MRPLLPVLLPALAGCALLGFGPPTGTIQGTVQQAPSYLPAPFAEVCVFGADTVCVRADRDGHYKLRLTEQAFWIRFRFGNQHPHQSASLRITVGQTLEVNCALVDRVILNDDPVACLPTRRG